MGIRNAPIHTNRCFESSIISTFKSESTQTKYVSDCKNYRFSSENALECKNFDFLHQHKEIHLQNHLKLLTEIAFWAII